MAIQNLETFESNKINHHTWQYTAFAGDDWTDDTDTFKTQWTQIQPEPDTNSNSNI